MCRSVPGKLLGLVLLSGVFTLLTAGGQSKRQETEAIQTWHNPPTIEDSIQGAKSFKPKNGFVPDEATAIRIAEAVCIPVYGEKEIIHERPFSATLKKGVWLVHGNVPDPPPVGGPMIVKIAQADGRILFMTQQM